MRSILLLVLFALALGTSADAGEIPPVPQASKDLRDLLKRTIQQIEVLYSKPPRTPAEVDLNFAAIELAASIKTFADSLEEERFPLRRADCIRSWKALENQVAFNKNPAARKLASDAIQAIERHIFPEIAVRTARVKLGDETHTVHILTQGKKLTSYMAPTHFLVCNDVTQGEKRFLGYACYDNQKDRTRLVLSLDAKLKTDARLFKLVKDQLEDQGEELEEGLPELTLVVRPKRDERTALEMFHGSVSRDVVRFVMQLNQQDGLQAVALANLAQPRGLPLTLELTSPNNPSVKGELHGLALSLAHRTHPFEDVPGKTTIRNLSPFPATVNYCLINGEKAPFPKPWVVYREGLYKNLPAGTTFPPEAVVYESLKFTEVLDKEFFIGYDGVSFDKIHIVNRLEKPHAEAKGRLLYVEIDATYIFTPSMRGAPPSERKAGTYRLAPYPAVGHDIYIPFLKRDIPGGSKVVIRGKAKYQNAERKFEFTSDGPVIEITEGVAK